MKAEVGVSFLLVTLSLTQGGPAVYRTLGHYVLDCSSGDVCFDPQQENDTVATLNDMTFCCSSGNIITISIRRTASNFNQSSTSSFISSDPFSGVVYSSQLTFPLRANSSNSSGQTAHSEVICECRQIDEEAIETFFDQMRQKVWNVFDATLARLARFFP